MTAISTTCFVVTFSAGEPWENEATIRKAMRAGAVTSWSVKTRRDRSFFLYSLLSPGDLSAVLVSPESAVHVRMHTTATSEVVS